jgi:hypothetical protein
MDETYIIQGGNKKWLQKKKKNTVSETWVQKGR